MVPEPPEIPTYSLLLPVHDRLQLLEMPQFDLQFLHLRLDQESN